MAAEPIISFNFDSGQCDYSPFPVLSFDQFLPNEFFASLVRDYPPINLFAHKATLGNKYSLSLANNKHNFDNFIQSSQPWSKFAKYVESSEFINAVFLTLERYQIDLGYRLQPGMVWQERCKHIVNRSLGYLSSLWSFRLIMGISPLRSRFEFSSLPAFGGELKPHTDAQQKIVTIVIPILNSNQWDQTWGGGTEIMRTIDDTKSFNRVNVQREFVDVEPIRTYDFIPNRALIFIKCDNSWHGVRPLTGPKGVFRNTVTINIESRLSGSYVE